MSRLRHDPLTGEPLLFAPERGLRPNAFDQRPMPAGAVCPFCPGNERETPPEVSRIGSAERWEVRVVPNRYPIVGTGGLAGAHEVVVETPEHEARFATLSSAQRVRVLRAWRERFAAHRRNRAIRHLVIFRNDGPRAGQSILHPHGQIIALPFLPERIRREAGHLRTRQKKGQPCPLCAETEVPARQVAANERFVAVVPEPSRAPYQVRVVPRRHQADFGLCDDGDLAALDRMLATLLPSMLERLDHPSYNLLVQSAPFRVANPEMFHWYVDLIPRLTVEGGFELATGIPIDILPSERAATELRDAGAERIER
ncbi:MAG TPA: DUF4931 domain-containing protein [Thermoanaerobaculia bacterium]|nr:DUF4931 domain-containing protein [Thermoanaerobaculia bacterium]